MIDFSNEFQCYIPFETEIVDGHKVKADCIGGNSSGICTHFLFDSIPNFYSGNFIRQEYLFIEKIYFKKEFRNLSSHIKNMCQ